MGAINIQLPTFGLDDMDTPQGKRRLLSYLFTLAEQVKYLSENIDGDNVRAEYSQELAKTASAQAQNEIGGTLGAELDAIEAQLTQIAENLSARIAAAQNTARDAQGRAEALEDDLGGVIDGAAAGTLAADEAGVRIKGQLTLDGLPTISGVTANLYIDNNGNLYKIIEE